MSEYVTQEKADLLSPLHFVFQTVAAVPNAIPITMLPM
jgi:hypothetical protein